MVGAVSGYSGVQWSSYIAPTRRNSSVAAENPSVSSAQKVSELGKSVQPVDAVPAAAPKASGGVEAALSAREGADAAEMAVRMRISPVESDEPAESAALSDVREEAGVLRNQEGVGAEESAAAQMTGAQDDRVAGASAASEDEQDALLGIDEARKAWVKEQAELKKEAAEELQAYLEEIKEVEETRSERVAELQAAMTEEGEAEGETLSQTGEENEEGRRLGSLELDYTVSMLQNYQMTNLLRAQINALVNSENASDFRDNLDAIQAINSKHLNGSPLGVVA